MAARIARDPPSARKQRGPATKRAWWPRLCPSGRPGGARDTPRSRYSIAKAQRYVAYARTTTPLRRAVFVLLFPVPALLTAVALSLIPLQDPKVGGMKANWGILVHHGAANWVCMIAGMFQARAASSIDHDAYSTRQIVAIATLAAAHTVGVFVLFGSVWRFPVPFYAGIGPWAYVGSLVWVHALCARAGRFPRAVRVQLVRYVAPLAVQVAQLPLYAGYSTLFTAATAWQQLVLVVLFPCLKYALRRVLFAVSRDFHDFAREIAVCGVEISASMYQAAIMQSTPSTVVAASILAMDVALSVVETKRYLDHRSIVPTNQVLARATTLLDSATLPTVDDRELARFATPTHGGGTTTTMATTMAVAVAPSPCAIAAPERDKHILTHALEMFQAAESIVLVEFLEVSIPLLNAGLLHMTSPLPSAQYHRELRPFYVDARLVGPALRSILLYATLQALTFVGMCAVLHVRYRLSAPTLLAFVLEDHVWSLQGKLVMWLPVTLAISIVHYGIDFTFKFDFTISD